MKIKLEAVQESLVNEAMFNMYYINTYIKYIQNALKLNCIKDVLRTNKIKSELLGTYSKTYIRKRKTVSKQCTNMGSTMTSNSKFLKSL